MVNHELERIWKWLWPDLRYCLSGTEKNEKPGRVGTVYVTCETVTSQIQVRSICAWVFGIGVDIVGRTVQPFHQTEWTFPFLPAGHH